MGLRANIITTNGGAIILQHEYTTLWGDYQDPTILHDISPTGRERPWRRWRLDADLLAEAYQTASCQTDGPDAAAWAARADRVRSCGTQPTFERHLSPDAVGGQYLTLKSANLCRDRLCPLCQWRRSLKMAAQARAVVAEVDRRKIARDRVGYSWIMLTLTQPNVPGPLLGAELDTMHHAYQRLTRSARWREGIKGWLRVTEVTRNTDPDSPYYGTYHPHIHTLLCVPKRYYTSGAYIPQYEWGILWAYYMRLAMPAIVDVRRVTAKGEVLQEGETQGSMGPAIAEVAKYAAKPGSYLIASDLEATVEAVITLATQLAGRRLYAWGGVCKEAAQALHLDSLETGDLVHIDEMSSADTPADGISRYMAYHWALGLRNYVLTRAWDAPASWAEAAAAAKERPKLAAAQRAKEAEADRANRAKLHRLQAAAGERITNRAVRAHDGYTLGLIEEVAAARDRQGDTPQIPGPAAQDSPPCPPPSAGD